MKKMIFLMFICMLLLCGCYQNQSSVENSIETMNSVDERASVDAGDFIDAGVEEMIHEENISERVEVVVSSEADTEGDTLFEKYPDEAGWMEARDCGDIPMLANATYIEASLASGLFLVSNPEELASFCYIVNTSQSGQGLFMQLQNDIDLSGYEWAPMGWHGGKVDLPFTCVVDGNGYTISNMTIDCDDSSVGFIGWENYCRVSNINFENASVSGNSDVGILTGQAIGGWYENCHVSGAVNGHQAGSLIGYSATSNIFDCTVDVTVNGELFEFLTWNDKEKSEIVIENPITIVLHDDYLVTRPPVEGYENLGWLITKDGVQVLHRNAEDELSYRYFRQDPGEYTICLTAWVDYQYVPVSNIVEYTIE